jgi:hypothetical protein
VFLSAKAIGKEALKTGAYILINIVQRAGWQYYQITFGVA